MTRTYDKQIRQILSEPSLNVMPMRATLFGGSDSCFDLVNQGMV